MTLRTRLRKRVSSRFADESPSTNGGLELKSLQLKFTRRLNRFCREEKVRNGPWKPDSELAIARDQAASLRRIAAALEEGLNVDRIKVCPLFRLSSPSTNRRNRWVSRQLISWRRMATPTPRLRLRPMVREWFAGDSVV